MIIKTKILATKQGTFLVIKYYNIMEGLWLELDYYQNFEMECSKDATMLQKFVEREMIFWISYRTQCGVWSSLSVSSGKGVFAYSKWSVLHNLSRERLKNCCACSWSADGSTMVSTKLNDRDSKINSEGLSSNREGGKNEFSKPSNHDGVWCTYHKKPRCMKETSWKLHGNIGWNGGFKSF